MRQLLVKLEKSGRIVVRCEHCGAAIVNVGLEYLRSGHQKVIDFDPQRLCECDDET